MAFYIVKHQDEYSISSFTVKDLLSLKAALNIADNCIPNESMQHLSRTLDAFINANYNEEPDSHSCSANADSYGYCQVCGAIVHGSLADYEEHGYDPPETVRY